MKGDEPCSAAKAETSEKGGAHHEVQNRSSPFRERSPRAGARLAGLLLVGRNGGRGNLQHRDCRPGILDRRGGYSRWWRGPGNRGSRLEMSKIPGGRPPAGGALIESPAHGHDRIPKWFRQLGWRPPSCLLTYDEVENKTSWADGDSLSGRSGFGALKCSRKSVASSGTKS